MTIFLTKKDYFSPFIPQKNSKFAALEHYNSMERLLHYVWKHKMLPLGDLLTTDGRVVEILDPGLLNRNAGPDFFNAKVKIGSTLWVGNVEIHLRASDWYHHCHDRDPRYNNVVLHVVSEADMDVKTQDGNYLPQMVVQIPASLKENYEELLHNDQYPPCYKIIPDLTRLQVHSWLAALQTERLEQKTQAIQKRVEQCNGSWEDGYFVTLARNYGFGINGEAFEMWAKNVPLHAVGKHRDDLFQIEAIFMGQAGLLQLESIPIAQLANLYYERKAGLSALLECETIEQLRQLLQTHVTPYWETHFMFGAESPRSTKKTSVSSANLMIINTAIPMLFAVGRHRQREDLCDRAFDLLEQLKAEDNHIIRMWKECGLEVQTAGDSQALIQLKKEYCDRKDCLRCRIGYEYLKA